MALEGTNIIGAERSAAGESVFQAYDPKAGAAIEPSFREATRAEISKALELASEAASEMQRLNSDRVAAFLNAMRDEIAALGDELVDRAAQETALDRDRLKGERERTLNQIKLFAEIVKEGSWVDARIDTAQPERKPLPRVDIRRMLQPIGPVAVFGASNFPLAFSVAGGDTASAFAARNPVVVKAHPAHPGTSELVANAIQRAVKSQAMPAGTFSMLHGRAPEVSLAVVSHCRTRAVAFTGSQRAGMALFQAAARRPDPIPVFSEMGSVNPVFVLPEALRSKGESIAEGLFRSVLLGVGQFCTCPGLVFVADGDGAQGFRQKLTELFEQAAPASMLNPAICKSYTEQLGEIAKLNGIEQHLASRIGDSSRAEGRPGLFVIDAEAWLETPSLHEEIFGPATILVKCRSQEQILLAASSLEGSLTATLHGAEAELSANSTLVEILTRKAGRLVFNGFPTGVEVGYAMHHGGPFPATADAKFTSVGAAAIYRFARPVCYQNFPEASLPPELHNANPRGIWRMINGKLSRDAI